MKALVLVDIQNDFLPGGALAVPNGDQVVPVANRLMPRFDLVVATQDWHPPDHASFAANHPGHQVGDVIQLGGVDQVLWPVHCVQGTRGAELAPGLDKSRIEQVFYKGVDRQVDSYSGFFDNDHRRDTGLGDYLKRRGVTDVAIVGLATDYCVKFTTLDACRLGFRTTVVQDGCRGVELKAGDVQQAIQQMRAAGAEVVNSSRLTPELPADHAERIERVQRSLDGLSVGDSFGERFFGSLDRARSMIATRTLPRAPWQYTDDTVMALSIANVLNQFGRIDQEELARQFAERYRRQPWRGYGATAHLILQRVSEGASWSSVAPAAFGGEGSMGNGAAMRVAPVGAYFSDDLAAAAREAGASAAVTHAHPEGQAGAVAVAVAAATAWQVAQGGDSAERQTVLARALAHTPAGPTREGIERAAQLPLDTAVLRAAELLGNGSRVIAPDTVPFCLWSAVRSFGSFEQAMWDTVSALGDCDTTCAIVGGIVALTAEIPPSWLAAREPLAL